MVPSSQLSVFFHSNRFPTTRQAQNLSAAVSREVELLNPKCVARHEMESGYKKGVSNFKPTLFNRKES